MLMVSPNVLDDDEFSKVVRFAPLISIDLIVRDPDRKVLVGVRNNEPAKNFYFVPGGRIRKDETLEAAFARILDAEIGCSVDFKEARSLGAYQHMYPNNRFGHPGYGTHYVVLAYELNLSRRPAIVLDGQHSIAKWMDEAELRAAPDVHRYTKAYFET
jgi:colanic acid biosynthesis protein WcaH